MRKSKYNTAEMIAGVTDENRHPEVDWGPAVGREILPPELFYGTGDATLPTGGGRYVIVHPCNDIGAWGKGFVVPLAKRYPQAEAEYRAWYRRKANPPFALGQVQFVEVAAQVWVANMIGQHGIGRRGPTAPIRYDALRECLGRVRAFAQECKADIQMPRIGCGLAGGDWEIVSKIVEQDRRTRSSKRSLSCTAWLCWYSTYRQKTLRVYNECEENNPCKCFWSSPKIG